MGYDEHLASAQDALAAGRWQAAREFFGLALGEQETPEALTGMGSTLWWLGDIRASLRHRERAFAIYRGDQRLRDAAAVALEIAVSYLSNLDNEAAARGWIARAKRAVSAGDDRSLDPWLWLMEGYVSSDPNQQLELLRRALDGARTSRDTDLELVAMADLGRALVFHGDVDGGLALLDEAMAGTYAGECQRLETVVWNSCSMLAACSVLQDLKRATEWCDAADTFTERFGGPFLQARCRSHYGRVLLATGHWEKAERELAAALSMSADLGREPRCEALAGLAELRLRQGQAEVAEQLLDEVAGWPLGAVVTARVLIARDHADRAVAVLNAQLQDLHEQDVEFVSVAATLTEAYLEVGDVTGADHMLQTLQRACPRHRHPQATALCARAAGLVAGATGRDVESASLLGDAAAAFDARELPYEVASTRLARAMVAAATDPALAAVEAGRALAVFGRLGARHDADRAAAVLRDLGMAPKPGARDVGLLSRRERDVLDLVARGMTNPQIAAQLYISRKTVAHHVSSILTKLNLSTRAEAAAYAAREGVNPTNVSIG